MATSKVQTGLRIEESDYYKIKQIAALEKRTLNNLVEHLVHQYILRYERDNGPVPEHQDE